MQSFISECRMDKSEMSYEYSIICNRNKRQKNVWKKGGYLPLK